MVVNLIPYPVTLLQIQTRETCQFHLNSFHDKADCFEKLQMNSIKQVAYECQISVNVLHSIPTFLELLFR